MSVQIHRLTGAGESASDVTAINTRLNAEDAHTTAGVTNPIVRPSAGTNYSFWAVFRLFFNGVGTGTINNIKWHTDGANGFGTGVTCKVQTATGYVQATGTTGTTGNQLTTGNYATLAGSPVNAFGYTSGSPLSVTGTITDPEDEYFGDYVVIQTEVGTTASAGATPQETITWKYDSTVSE